MRDAGSEALYSAGFIGLPMCHGHTLLSKATDRQKRREGIKIGLFAVFFYSKLFSSRKKDKEMTLYELCEVFAALVLPACVFGR